jgi:hypothetical protein
MNIIINIDENTIENQQPKIYNLGSVITTIQDLLDNSTITITNYRTIILQFIDLDLSVKHCFLNLNDYTKGDQYGLGQNVLESDLIYFSSGSSGDFIPLNGTTNGNPITGDIEIQANQIHNIFQGDLNTNHKAIVFPDEDGIIFNFVETSSSGNFIFTSQGLRINSDFPLSHGLSGTQDYTPNITNLDYTQKKYVDQKVADSRPYKVYTALLSQSGTNAPTVGTPLENTTGGSLTFSYVDVGEFIATCVGFTIPVGKFVPSSYISQLDDLILSMERTSDTSIRIATCAINRTQANDAVYGTTPFSFKVYN